MCSNKFKITDPWRVKREGALYYTQLCSEHLSIVHTFNYIHTYFAFIKPTVNALSYQTIK